MFWSTLLKGKSLNGYMFLQFLLHLKEMSQVPRVLKKPSPAVNSSICLSGTTIPVEKGIEAEFYGADLLLSGSRVLQCCHFCVAGTWWIYHDLCLRFTEDLWFPRVAQWCGMAKCGIFDKGRVGNISLLFPCQSYSDCHFHYPIPMFLKGCPKQKSVVENSCDVMVVAHGIFFCSPAVF